MRESRSQRRASKPPQCTRASRKPHRKPHLMHIQIQHQHALDAQVLLRQQRRGKERCRAAAATSHSCGDLRLCGVLCEQLRDEGQGRQCNAGPGAGKHA